MMQDYQVRVVEERDELNGRLERLLEFIDDDPVYLGLDGAEQSRLVRQSEAMSDYLDILDDRIANFSG